MNGDPGMKIEEWEARAEAVRRASLAGDLVSADEILPGGNEEWTEFLAEAPMEAADITSVREGGKVYLFSERHMTRAFAEAAALGASGDRVRIIASTVRTESATYPRPTPLETFQLGPFYLNEEEIAAALTLLQADAQYEDIATVGASDGARFLFSSRHLNRDQAAAMAERLAVTRFDNP